MKTYRIYKNGHIVREIVGDEVELLTWIQENVLARNKTTYRNGDPKLMRALLYEDARVAGLDIKSKRYESKAKQESSF